MRRIIFSSIGLSLAVSLAAQQKEGKVIYERTVQAQVTMALNGAEPATQQITRKNRFELNFADGKSSFQEIEDDIPDDGFGAGGGQAVVRFGAGADDIVFCDFNRGKIIEQRSFMDKQFLITDSLKKTIPWKLTEETKTILNHVCRKAVGEKIGKRMTMTMENGAMVRKEVDDTSTVVAWFTTDIPVSVGPENPGELPGLILELESNRGRTVYTAIEIQPKPNLSAIKEPTKGKKLTRQEYATETRKLMDEMQKNGGFRFRSAG